MIDLIRCYIYQNFGGQYIQDLLVHFDLELVGLYAPDLVGQFIMDYAVNPLSEFMIFMSIAWGGFCIFGLMLTVLAIPSTKVNPSTLAGKFI